MGPQKKSKKFYAVSVGRRIGIFSSWNQASKSVTAFPRAAYKGYQTLEQAKMAMRQAGIADPRVYEEGEEGRNSSDGENTDPTEADTATHVKQAAQAGPHVCEVGDGEGRDRDKGEKTGTVESTGGDGESEGGREKEGEGGENGGKAGTVTFLGGDGENEGGREKEGEGGENGGKTGTVTFLGGDGESEEEGEQKQGEGGATTAQYTSTENEEDKAEEAKDSEETKTKQDGQIEGNMGDKDKETVDVTDMRQSREEDQEKKEDEKTDAKPANNKEQKEEKLEDLENQESTDNDKTHVESEHVRGDHDQTELKQIDLGAEEQDEHNCWCKEQKKERKIKCSDCGHKIHWSCTDLPLYQVGVYVNTHRKYTCKLCADRYIDEKIREDYDSLGRGSNEQDKATSTGQKHHQTTTHCSKDTDQDHVGSAATQAFISQSLAAQQQQTCSILVNIEQAIVSLVEQVQASEEMRGDAMAQLMLDKREQPASSDAETMTEKQSREQTVQTSGTEEEAENNSSNLQGKEKASPPMPHSPPPSPALPPEVEASPSCPPKPNPNPHAEDHPLSPLDHKDRAPRENLENDISDSSSSDSEDPEDRSSIDSRDDNEQVLPHLKIMHDSVLADIDADRLGRSYGLRVSKQRAGNTNTCFSQQGQLDEADAILIHVGVNDLKTQSADTVGKNFCKGIKTMLEHTNKKTQIIISKVAPTQNEDLFAKSEVLNAQIYADLHAEPRVSFVSHHQLQRKGQKHLKDGIHPTLRGAGIIAGNIGRHAENLLWQRQKSRRNARRPYQQSHRGEHTSSQLHQAGQKLNTETTDNKQQQRDQTNNKKDYKEEKDKHERQQYQEGVNNSHKDTDRYHQDSSSSRHQSNIKGRFQNSKGGDKYGRHHYQDRDIRYSKQDHHSGNKGGNDQQEGQYHIDMASRDIRETGGGQNRQHHHQDHGYGGSWRRDRDEGQYNDDRDRHYNYRGGNGQQHHCHGSSRDGREGQHHHGDKSPSSLWGDYGREGDRHKVHGQGKHRGNYRWGRQWENYRQKGHRDNYGHEGNWDDCRRGSHWGDYGQEGHRGDYGQKRHWGNYRQGSHWSDYGQEGQGGDYRWKRQWGNHRNRSHWADNGQEEHGGDYRQERDWGNHVRDRTWEGQYNHGYRHDNLWGSTGQENQHHRNGDGNDGRRGDSRQEAQHYHFERRGPWRRGWQEHDYHPRDGRYKRWDDNHQEGHQWRDGRPFYSGGR